MIVSLKEARDNLHRIKATGAVQTCPCCDRTVKVYKRGITYPMVMNLTQIAINYPHPVHTSRLRVGANAGDVAKLRHWSLVKRLDAGVYECTQKGMDFLKGERPVMSYLFMYNSQVVGNSGDFVYVEDCVDGFDIDVAMKSFTPQEIAELSKGPKL